jgi:small nuclear ribonucleoprotein D2
MTDLTWRPYWSTTHNEGKMTTKEREARNQEEFSTGPLSILTDSVKNNTQVLINCHSDKKLLGRVRAFDKHCNMVLEGVKEVWTTELKAWHNKKMPKHVHKDRFLGKMFLRGDSVIMIVKIGGQMFPCAISHHDSDHKKPVTLPSQARNYKEMGGGMTAKPEGYCVRYVVMGFEDTREISKDQYHHDPED